MKLDSLPLASMPEPEREPATDETNGGGAASDKRREDDEQLQ